MPPDVFIRVAEESGLIVDLGDVVLQTGRQRRGVTARGGRRPDRHQREHLRAAAHGAGVRRLGALRAGDHGETGLILEITERDGIGTDDVSLGAMRELADAGVQFAIDDFGVGFSSISYLQDMPVRTIKADASFSEGIDRDERSCALLCSIMMMGQALGLDVVVEGIERSSQLDHLREHVHAPYAQGYLMHRPMVLGTLLDVVRDNRSIPAALSLEPPRDAPGNVATPA